MEVRKGFAAYAAAYPETGKEYQFFVQGVPCISGYAADNEALKNAYSFISMD